MLFRIRFGQLFLTSNKSFVRDKNAAILMDSWSALTWIYENNDLYVEYRMRVERA